jgi:outer membrane protein assembly factor BamB
MSHAIMKRILGLTVAALILAHPAVTAQESKAAGNDKAMLGAKEFYPSAEKPIGWRGDGSGRYPAATPPTTWERKKDGTGYATKGVVWMTPLPDTGVSCPIIVGDRIFMTSEVSDLLCFDKKSGRLLWIRSNPEFEGLSEEDAKAEPAVAQKLAPLLPELAKANEELVKALNEKMAAAPKATATDMTKIAAKKREVEKKILEEQKAIDKKGFDRYWGQAVFGFSGATPTSDGKNICAFFTTGVSVCYDFDGKRKWITRGKGGGSEHGNFASPVLVENKLAVWANEMRGYDVETGKLAWSHPAKASNSYGSMFRFKSGNDMVAAFQCGFFVRARDGEAIWGTNIFGDAVSTPIVEGDTLYTWIGYPRTSEKLGFKAYKIPASTMATKLTPAYTFKMDWADDELPVDKKKNPFDRGFVSSPLYVDGLIYQMTQGCGLLVNDAATGELVYRKVLPLKPRTQYWNWAGGSTSPTLAGKYIYLMDNQGGTVIIEPGREYKEVARNKLEESKDGKEQVQTVSTPVFEGAHMYYRTPGFLYCIGQ